MSSGSGILVSRPGKNTLVFRWMVMMLVLLCLAGAGAAGFTFNKYNLRVPSHNIFLVLFEHVAGIMGFRERHMILELSIRCYEGIRCSVGGTYSRLRLKCTM